ncbi:MAG: protein-tyrosine phosphatase [Thioalkalivibrio sp.]|nr:MAG: protein-tyrosine phosphatase [Thioalkalivibrio sp.]
MKMITSSPDNRRLDGMVDLHGHLLPGIDDGARDLEQALNMARLAVADGIVISVLTPHHLNGVYDNPAMHVREQCASFRRALREQDIPLDVRPGAECHLVPELPAALAKGTALTIADRKRSVLVELPVYTVPLGAYSILEDILAMGLQPIIAHPERNGELVDGSEKLAEWIEMGCLAQVTAQSCTGRFGPQVQRAARRMLRNGLIHVMASDAHRDKRRVPELRAARETVAQWTSHEVATLLTEDFPRALADGQPVAVDRLKHALPSRQRGWANWLRRLRA